MHLLDVTQFQHLEDEGKRQPGVCGKYFLMSLKHLKTSLMLMENNISDFSWSLLERFVVLLYDWTSDLQTVNDARKQLFTQKSRSLENIPPTQAALKQHTKRANYQAHCWSMTVIQIPELPSPAEWPWGWWKDATGWHPLWTTLPEASQCCHELICCACKKGCTARCKCVKAALRCTHSAPALGNVKDRHS